jgi:hypothetical protein
MSRRKSKEMSSGVLVSPCVMEKILDYERPKQRKRTRKLKRNFEQTGSVLDFTSMNTALNKGAFVSSQYVIRADD